MFHIGHAKNFLQLFVEQHLRNTLHLKQSKWKLSIWNSEMKSNVWRIIYLILLAGCFQTFEKQFEAID